MITLLALIFPISTKALLMQSISWHSERLETGFSILLAIPAQVFLDTDFQ